MKRVAITGMGVVSPVGIGVADFWASLVAGRSGIHCITAFPVDDYSTRFGGYIDDFDPSAVVDRKEQRRMSRFQQMAMVAATEAMEDSGLKITDDNADRVGVIVGSGIGGLHTMEDQTRVLLERGPSRISPLLVPMMIVDLAAGHISIRFGAKGINFAPVSACSTSNHSVGEAYNAIVRGDADAVIAGGFDCGITPLGLAGFCAARSLSQRNDDPAHASRPFDAGRDGFVMGEGGGAVILEDWDLAVARGATIRGEFLGYGASADAFHITAPAPDGSGAKRSMRSALAHAGIDPAEVGYINAHGTSTELGDAAETGAIKEVFGGREATPPVSSTKSMTGHCLGGAGAIELVACLKALETGILPPTINYTDPDPACDLDYVPNEARKADISVAMSNSFGFGGHNATLVVARPDR
jgi:3-oxoacyl-[acyl-carrier-protein] synthase II